MAINMSDDPAELGRFSERLVQFTCATAQLIEANANLRIRNLWHSEYINVRLECTRIIINRFAIDNVNAQQAACECIDFLIVEGQLRDDLAQKAHQSSLNQTNKQSN